MMIELDTAAIWVLLTIASVLACLVFSRWSPDLILMGAVTFLLVGGILLPHQALMGFANPGVMTIAALYVVAGALKETGALHWIAARVLGQPRGMRQTQLRLLVPAGALSAFLNNTAVVAMFIPVVQDWAQRLGVPASKLFLPLSYVSILGGTCTLIGTSTNLVVDGLLQTHLGIRLGLFELAWIGLPLLLSGLVYLVFIAPRLLPDAGGLQAQLQQVREYGVEVEVEAKGPLVGLTIQQAGLRHLAFGYLAEIERHGRLLTAVNPEHELHADDHLYFIGAPECAAELRRIRGLRPASGSLHKMDVANHQRCLVEVVLGGEFSGLDMTIREYQFRTRFNAVILSVSRNGQRIAGKLGDIRLRMGDTLLLEAGQNFVEQYRFRRDFLLVSPLNDSTPPDFRRAPLSLATVVVMVLVSASGLLSILEAALLACGVLLASGCVTAAKARRSIDLPVLIVIAASFSLGVAMTETGAADWIAQVLLVSDQLTPWLALLMVYVLTACFTELITNNAAAVLMFPVVLALSEQMGVSVMPFILVVMFAASASFLTPIGYQTNLMVFGPGRYRLVDYLRVGLPLSVISCFLVVSLVPFVWEF